MGSVFTPTLCIYSTISVLGRTVLGMVFTICFHYLCWEDGSRKAMSKGLNSKNGERFTEPVRQDVALLYELPWWGGHRQLQHFIGIGNTLIFYPSNPPPNATHPTTYWSVLQHPTSLHHFYQQGGKPDLSGEYGSFSDNREKKP